MPCLTCGALIRTSTAAVLKSALTRHNISINCHVMIPLIDILLPRHPAYLEQVQESHGRAICLEGHLCLQRSGVNHVHVPAVKSHGKQPPGRTAACDVRTKEGRGGEGWSSVVEERESTPLTHERRCEGGVDEGATQGVKGGSDRDEQNRGRILTEWSVSVACAVWR